MIALFYKYIKIFDELFKSLNFLFLLSFRHILLAHSFRILWLIFESIKALKIKTSTLFNLDFGNNTIIMLLFFFVNY